MTQTYPAVLPSTLKVTDGTALYNPTPSAYADANVNSVPNFEPSQYSEKTTNHPAGESDRTAATIVSKACNMPY